MPSFVIEGSTLKNMVIKGSRLLERDRPETTTPDKRSNRYG